MYQLAITVNSLQETLQVIQQRIAAVNSVTEKAQLKQAARTTQATINKLQNIYLGGY